MRAILVIDAVLADREPAVLTRLGVGLADEGVRVVYAVPQGHALGGEVFAQTVAYDDRGLFRSVGSRARSLSDGIAALARPESEAPATVIHAFGAGCWGIAGELSRAFDVPLILEVSSLREARRVAGWIPLLQRDGVVVLIADPALERPVRAEGAASLVLRVCPWGVHAPAGPRPIMPAGSTVAVVVAGSGADGEGFRAAVQGLARTSGDWVAFADARGVQRAGAWPDIRRLRLENRITLIPDVDAMRDLALQADVLICPEQTGEQRTVGLDAMAAGLAVIAAADAGVSWLIDRRTARLVAAPDPDLWRAVIDDVLADPGAARALGASARDYVRANHRVSTQVSIVLDVYEWLSHRGAGFIGPGGSPQAR